MNYKKIIIFGGIFIVLFLILVIFVIRSNKGTNNTDQESQTFREFLPFGKGGNILPRQSDEQIKQVENGEVVTDKKDKKIYQISVFPVSGAGIYEEEYIYQEEETKLEKRGLEQHVRYVNKATGNVYQNNIKGSSEKKITETLLPYIYEGSFGLNSEMVLFRYLKEDKKTITTYGSTLPKIITGGDSTLSVSGGFLPENITDYAVSPDKKQIFSIIKNNTGTIGIISDFKGDNKKTIFDFPFSEWRVYWPIQKSIILTTKPSFNILGYSYILNSDTGVISRLIGDKSGLTTLPNHDMTKVLFSETKNNILNLFVYDIKTKTETQLRISTLPEKCVWSKKENHIVYCAVPKQSPIGQMPDIWYQGLISFNDEFFKIDTKNNLINSLPSFKEEVGQFIDGTNLFLDNTESYLLFMNKNDEILWSMDIL